MATIVNFVDTPERCFSQLKFEDDGARLLITITVQPEPSITIVKVRRVWVATIPRETIWRYNAAIADGDQAFLDDMQTMFVDPARPQPLLKSVVQALEPCRSQDSALKELLARETLLRS